MEYIFLAARDLIDNQKVQAIIGPQTWAETSLVAEVCTQKSIPFLSLADATPEWAMKKWPFLLQSSPRQIMQMKAIAEIVKSWKLYNVSMIYEDGDSSSTEVLSRLSEALTSVGTELSNVLTVPPLVSSSLSQQLEKLREGQCRVLIVHLSFPLALHLFEMAMADNESGRSTGNWRKKMVVLVDQLRGFPSLACKNMWKMGRDDPRRMLFVG